MKSTILSLIVLPQNDLITNLETTLNNLVAAGQRLAPAVAAVIGVVAMLMYMYSDKFADVAKTKMFKIFVGVGVIAGITTVINWMTSTAKF
ncbi:hypothetical protein ABG980_02940 [Enterococcus casseliflavus]|uniref:hypothetical protein n=1 Tax=Enterococcus casseliflavus TaxID=37734 RepID=UPI00232FEEBF|nr:hypothetical protein [Enterococcus casseliflavus]MDB1696118.1 hypothetical protein [Enterococcus casseliflavus]MDB1699788.1 hypothetical protein [Enterococcus casseliflavus]MDB1702028.1 hypothetical protein [Enterococcus casseliflavus]MDB1704629.1 hypothetical protein [Enterococcus casseliflavus]